MQTVLSDTGVPGAGLALVRMSGVEWAGGVGLADRDRKTPVTADTHFRAGSISKSFIASAIVQLYLDDEIDLDTPVSEIAPEIHIDNAWEPAHPVRVIHLLQHTAGFDDMHFNEMYNVSDPPDMPLEDVLKINPASRVVRWQPGTRMAYSNPGYTIAAYLIEKITGEKYEDRIAEKIFKPAGMPTSSFVLTKDDEAILAKGYRDRTGPPVPYSQIYLRPVRQSPHLGAGAWPMGARAAELGRNGNRSRDRSRISQQHGAPAHDGRVVCGTAHRLWQRHREHAGRRLPDARPWRRHRRFHLALRLFDVARRRLRHPPELDALARSDAPHRQARGSLSQGRCRTAAQAESDGRGGHASQATRATITTPTRATRRSRSSSG